MTVKHLSHLITDETLFDLTRILQETYEGHPSFDYNSYFQEFKIFHAPALIDDLKKDGLPITHSVCDGIEWESTEFRVGDMQVRVKCLTEERGRQ
jgi:hypothetical protein